MKETLKQRLLDFYQIDEKTYQELIKDSTIEDFAMGHKFDRMEEAVALVKDAIKNLKRIAIYGDYDADGIMGTSVLVKMFSYINYPVDYYIPSRYLDGYGLTLNDAEKAVAEGVGLLITVDNGVSAFEGIKYLHDHGVAVLILDHHTMQDALPEADVIIHPTYSHFGDIASSGAFTAFMFASSFLGYVDKYLATLASISLISDMMPLLDYNRRLLKAVISNYQDGEFLAIDLLKDGDTFDEVSIGMRIAPKINALGRMIETDEINKIIPFFVSDDKELVLNYINWINDTNESRKDASKLAVEEVKDVSKEDAALVIVSDAKEGLLGLIANHLCGSYHVPVVVFGKEMSGDTLKGSCRTPEGFNVVEAFNQLSDIIISSGGHAMAGGCSIKIEDFEVFKKRFIEIAQKAEIKEYVEKNIPLGLTEVSFENYELVKSFSPFGESWPAPTFLIPRILSTSLTFSRDNKHILTYIGQGVKLVGFNFPKEDITQLKYIDLLGKMRTSTYRGLTSLEFGIKDIKESKK